jgi:hypothetical protein
MRPECVVLPAPAIGQALSLGHGGEQLDIEELIPKPVVERFGKTVLPRRPWLDEGCGGAAAFAPAPQGVSD